MQIDESSVVSLYTANNLHELSENHLNAIGYYRALIENGVSHYIDNISGEIALLKLNDQFIPLLITSNNYHDSYVCSPYGHYVALAIESAQTIKNRWIKHLAYFGLQNLGKIIKAGSINSTIYINHSLFSTDLHSQNLSKDLLDKAIFFLCTVFPKHTLIVRSLNSHLNASLKKDLKTSGCKFIATRHIYLTEIKKPELFKTRIIKSDLKLWKESGYEVIDQKDFTKEEDIRVLDLYTKLVIESHSAFNPKLNQNFLQLAKKYSMLQMKALKKDGVIEGVAGYVITNDKTLLCSFFGYDKNAQNKTQIYRLLSTLLFLEASEKASVFHQSAGASFYKKVRRAKGFQEYQALYIKHLSLKQKLIWHLLRAIINGFAVPFMKRY